MYGVSLNCINAIPTKRLNVASGNAPFFIDCELKKAANLFKAPEKISESIKNLERFVKESKV